MKRRSGKGLDDHHRDTVAEIDERAKNDPTIGESITELMRGPLPTNDTASTNAQIRHAVDTEYRGVWKPVQQVKPKKERK